MKGFIRYPRKEEAAWWNEVLVCDFEGEPRLTFERQSGEVTDKRTGKIYRPGGIGSKQLYRLSETSQLLVDNSGISCRFNDCKVTEEWPTTHRRILRCGPFIVYVKPEDDSLSFDLLGQDDVDILQAIIAFHLVPPANGD